MSGSALEITREFDAPRSQVWFAYTESERLALWRVPPGCAWGGCRMDFQPGGMFHFLMLLPQGKEIWERWVFLEMETFEKIIFVASFSEETGGVTRHSSHPSWPLGVLHQIRFWDTAAGGSRLTLQAEPFQASDAEKQAFREAHSRVRDETESAWNRLSEYLGKTKNGN